MPFASGSDRGGSGQRWSAVPAGSSAPATKQLILNKIDSIGELQGDGTVSETFTHTFEFDPSVKEF